MSQIAFVETPCGRVGSCIVHIEDHRTDTARLFFSDNSDNTDSDIIASDIATVNSPATPQSDEADEDATLVRLPTVNWRRVVIPNTCRHCLNAHDIVIFISRSGDTRATMPKGLCFEEWF